MRQGTSRIYLVHSVISRFSNIDGREDVDKQDRRPDLRINMPRLYRYSTTSAKRGCIGARMDYPEMFKEELEWAYYLGVPSVFGPELSRENNSNYAGLVSTFINRKFNSPVRVYSVFYSIVLDSCRHSVRWRVGCISSRRIIRRHSRLEAMERVPLPT